MILPLRQLAACLCTCALTLAALSSSSSAEDLLATRLTSLLGQERQALAVVPSAHMSALTAPPSASDRDISTVPSSLAYDESYLASLPKASGDAQWDCLARAIYFEARGESVKGMFAVGEVILNRVDSGTFPGNVCNVVNQGASRRNACQFSYACDGIADRINEPAAWAEVGKIARLLLDGAPRVLTDGATYFHTASTHPSWARHFDKTVQIGAHLFYREPIRTASN